MRAHSCLFLALLVMSALLHGCGESDSAQPRDVVLTADTFRDGKLVLGSPSLTAGIEGDGPITDEELNVWLNDPKNHEPLQVVLPLSLAEEESSVNIPQDNPLTRAKIELGRQLFFDQRLSGIGTFSCAVCHRPEQSYSSYQVMPEVERSVSPVLNRILSQHQFWDGRAATLEEQPKSPISNPFEMNSTPEKSTARIAAISGYRLQFERIFGEVSFANICKALASFERCLVAADSAWDRGELSAAAKRGELLFFSERLGCADCHPGRNLTDEQFHNLGAHHLVHEQDAGRAKVTSAESDRGSFKTPTLRNVAVTPPYLHNGAISTLEATIDFFDRGGGKVGGSETPLVPLGLTAEEKQDLIEFLSSLTSEFPPVEQTRLPL